MNLFVTAGTGFVGAAIVRKLRERGHEVTTLVRDSGKARRLLGDDVRLIVGDMREPDTYVAEAGRNAVTIHCAQLTVPGRFTSRAKHRINAADRIMTEALAEVCRTNGTTLLYTSGCFNYGDCGESWITEATPANPSPLGEGHQAMVDYLMKQHRRNGLRVVVLTAGFVYGPGGLFKSAFYDTLQKGQLRVFGKGSNYWSPVHVDDLALAYALAAEGDFAGETFNVVDDAPLTLRSLVDELTAGAGKKPGRTHQSLAHRSAARPPTRGIADRFLQGP